MAHDPDHGLNSDARVTRFIARQKDWAEAMAAARDILLAQGLTETIKWGQPTYVEGGNIAILGGFKSGLRVILPKGALIDDPALISPGENSRSGRYLQYRSAAEVEAGAAELRRIIAEARRLEASRARVDFSADPEPDWPEELISACEEDAELEEAFLALTPGRRRYWILHIAEAKQVKTRLARIARGRPAILAGKGVNE